MSGYARRVVGGWRSTRSASSKTCVTREGGTGEVLGRPPARKRWRESGTASKGEEEDKFLERKTQTSASEKTVALDQRRAVEEGPLPGGQGIQQEEPRAGMEGGAAESWGGWSRPAESGRLCVESGGEPRALARGVADEDVQAVRAATGPHSEGGQEGRVATSWDSRRS